MQICTCCKLDNHLEWSFFSANFIQFFLKATELSKYLLWSQIMEEVSYSLPLTMIILCNKTIFYTRKKRTQLEIKLPEINHQSSRYCIVIVVTKLGASRNFDHNLDMMWQKWKTPLFMYVSLGVSKNSGCNNLESWVDNNLDKVPLLCDFGCCKEFWWQSWKSTTIEIEGIWSIYVPMRVFQRILITIWTVWQQSKEPSYFCAIGYFNVL